MQYHRRSVSYAGQPYRFEKIGALDQDRAQVTWAVSRQGEFIGTMSCAEEITTRDFDLRCAGWLQDLLGHAKTP